MTRSPTVRFLLGLLVTLGAVTGLSSYSLYRLHGLRKDDLNIVDLNRHEALQLLRVQNDLNAIGLKLRDMTINLDSSQLRHYKQEFSVLHLDLQRALRYELRLDPNRRPAGDGEDITAILRRFWDSSDEMFEAAGSGHQALARQLAGTTLSQLQAEMSTRVSALLERNNASEEQADRRIDEIYESAEKDIYLFLTMTMLGIAAMSLYLIYWNRKFFWQLESLSRQRRVLAARLISVQEEVLRSVSRELHDEFGQILTAVGAMLARAERKGVPPDSPLRTELSEVREITHNTLEKIRSLSQMLHPAVIDDYGLVKAVEWYAAIFERQNGLKTTVSLSGIAMRITGEPAIHCFRIVQEALTNAAKHSGTDRAAVSMEFTADTLKLAIRDFGRGASTPKKKEGSGLGLIAMRERAELIGAKFNFESVAGVGTTISLSIPLKRDDLAEDEVENLDGEQVGIRQR